MSDFMKYTKIPIIVYYGDNLPATTNVPKFTSGRAACIRMRQWAEILNGLGGDVTVIHPRKSAARQYYFPMST